MTYTRRFATPALAAGILVLHLAHPRPLSAQAPDPLRITVPTVVVTAQKEPEDVQRLPVSVTVVPRQTLSAEDITSISQAGIFAPNTFFTEFQARKLSFAHFRGIGGGPGNPAITTYVDGVPMIHTNASSIELVDVDQVEFVRGGQSALFGRNALGGIVNVTSSRPSLTEWVGSVSAPFGNYGEIETRGTVSGPVSARSGISLSAGRSVRDGFTTNDFRDTDIDERDNIFGKAQYLWSPAAEWETRIIVSGERARDGDYALSDLGGLRANPFHASRNFEGRTDRDVVSGAFLVRRTGERLSFSSTTGIVDWRTKDETDLDYSPMPLLIRHNDEQATQFTQEVRLASATNAPVSVGSASMRWQAGVFFFTQGYDQDAVNTYSPFVLSPQVPFEVQQHTPIAGLDDLGIGLYGQGTFTFHEKIDLAVGGRFDHEQKDALLETSFTPPLFPPTIVDASRSFSNVSPQVSISYRVQPDRMVYASVGSGYKSGGFNPASPAGAESYGEEHTWQVEGGVKTTWAEGRLRANAAVFYINWDDLQLNLPNPNIPAQFYIANAAGAGSSGVELELTGRVTEALNLFAMFGATNGTFQDGSQSSGADVSGNDLPSTPGVTATLGAAYTRAVGAGANLYARGDVAIVGSYQYDDANTAGQDAYSLTNVRAGLRRGALFGEFWMRNAFDTEYIPVAFAYPGLAPSGFIGEMGAPRTIGVRLGVQF